jgi:restriction endonuclease Mrr
VDEKEVIKEVRDLMKKEKKSSIVEEPNKEVEWQEELLDAIHKMSPAGFERLVQRLLRELRIPVKSHTESGACRTVGREKTLVTIL